jgi:hypothetical protein
MRFAAEVRIRSSPVMMPVRFSGSAASHLAQPVHGVGQRELLP